MKLRRIRVQNFRNLRDVTVVPGPLTVIIGENGAGKSNFIHALRLLFDPNAQQQLRPALRESDINSEALAAGTREFTVDVEIGGLSEHPDLQALFMECLANDADDEYVTVQGRYAPDDDDELHWDAFVQPPPGSKAKPLRFASRMERFLPLYYLDAVRDASRDARVARGSLLDRLFQNVDLVPVASEVRAAIDEASAALVGASDVQALQSALETAARSLIPGGQAKVSLSLAGQDTRELLRTLQVLLSTRPGEPGLPLDQHGTGFQNLLLLAMYQCRREGASQVQVHPILAVEEPEAHLHPHAQRRLLNQLERLGGVTLITTHSPTIAASTKPSNIVRLHGSTAADTKAFQIEAGTLLGKEARDFEVTIRNGRSEAFFARSAVLVEGRSEALVLPAFAEQLGIQLDRDGVSIIDAGGNAFGYAIRTLGPRGLGIPLVVTFDTDALRHDAKLVRTAASVGSLDQGVAAKAAKGDPAERLKALETAGWIPVPENFEHAVCASGYLEVVVAAIDGEGRKDSLETYLKAKGMMLDAASVAEFIRKDDRLKLPVARAVLIAVPEVNRVPLCYEQALRVAVGLAVP